MSHERAILQFKCHNKKVENNTLIYVFQEPEPILCENRLKEKLQKGFSYDVITYQPGSYPGQLFNIVVYYFNSIFEMSKSFRIVKITVLLQ